MAAACSDPDEAAGHLAAGAEEPNEGLIGLCRCGQPGQSLRTVALLFTSEQLVWAREGAFTGTSSGAVRWREVTEVRAFGPEGQPPGIELHVAGSAPLVFTDFRGRGVLFEGEAASFELQGVYALTARLRRSNHRTREYV